VAGAWLLGQGFLESDSLVPSSFVQTWRRCGSFEPLVLLEVCLVLLGDSGLGPLVPIEVSLGRLGAPHLWQFVESLSPLEFDGFS
jgi:hypothetical protein